MPGGRLLRICGLGVASWTGRETGKGDCRWFCSWSCCCCVSCLVFLVWAEKDGGEYVSSRDGRFGRGAAAKGV